MSLPYELPDKHYVKVRLDQDYDGTVVPLLIKLRDGITLKIDRIYEKGQAASFKVGGQGTRYICETTIEDSESIMTKRVKLFHDHFEERWFVED